MSEVRDRLQGLELRRKFDGERMEQLSDKVHKTAEDVAAMRVCMRDMERTLESNCANNKATRDLLTDTVMPALTKLNEAKTKGTGFLLGITMAGVGGGASATALLKLLG